MLLTLASLICIVIVMIGQMSMKDNNPPTTALGRELYFFKVRSYLSHLKCKPNNPTGRHKRIQKGPRKHQRPPPRQHPNRQRPPQLAPRRRLVQGPQGLLPSRSLVILRGRQRRQDGRRDNHLVLQIQIQLLVRPLLRLGAQGHICAEDCGRRHAKGTRHVQESCGMDGVEFWNCAAAERCRVYYWVLCDFQSLGKSGYDDRIYRKSPLQYTHPYIMV
jgi:hypothetical protein